MPSPFVRFSELHPWRLSAGKVGLALLIAAPGCRSGYEILGDGEGVNLGGSTGDGDGDASGGDGPSGDGDSSVQTGGSPATGGTDFGGASPETGGSAVACPTDALFCSGFEVPLLDEWTEISSAHASCLVELASTPVLNGDGSLYVYAPTNRNAARINYVFDDPITSGPLSLRAWFYLPSSVVLDAGAVILELKDPHTGSLNKASINLGPNDTVIVEATTDIAPTTSTSAAGAFDRDVWNCAVLRLNVADAGSIEVEINGENVHSLGPLNVNPPDGFARAIVGLYKLGSTTVEMYFDEVAVAQEELTCP